MTIGEVSLNFGPAAALIRDAFWLTCSHFSADADAIVKAIEHIEKAVKADGGKLGPLQKRWPRRVAVLPSQLPDKAEWCKQTVPKDNEIAKQAAKATCRDLGTSFTRNPYL